MKFQLAHLTHEDLNHWILQRIDSLIRRYGEKDGLVVIRDDGHLVYINNVGRELLGPSLAGEADVSVFSFTEASSLVRRVLSGEEVDYYLLELEDKTMIISATPLMRGHEVVAAIFWTREVP